MTSATQYLDGAEGFILICFIGEVLHQFIQKDIIPQQNIPLNITLWSKYVESFYVIAGIRAYLWSQINMVGHMKLFCKKFIHYQITHTLFCVCLYYISYSNYRVNWQNLLILQNYFQSRNDIFDLGAVFAQIFQGYNIIICLSKSYFGKYGVVYQYLTIFSIFLLRIIYITRAIYVNNYYHNPQTFTGQGLQELMAFIIVFRLKHHIQTNQLDQKYLTNTNTIFIDITIFVSVVVLFIVSRAINNIYQEGQIYQQKIMVWLAYILFRPVIITILGILAILIEYSSIIKSFLEQYAFSNLVYRTRMFIMVSTGIFYQLMLYQAKYIKIGPYDQCLSFIVVIGAMTVIQFTSILLFGLMMPIILLLFKVFDDFCEQISNHIILVKANLRTKSIQKELNAAGKQ
ncbi:Transmembrane domain-containing protein [Spironucleus salmonicida]|uniref:Transmembrane domain-containing protein n=1 Tax=Spironucleus salmonicida TaxID=348837 RepID=V6LUJ4_9EUKA|nr:Transmembrane domain-containing protein [Spironucleus salmonicida]|eukprot:EST47376.1 Transmembrane domain-containing protein [Spironucleus salmonicida]